MGESLHQSGESSTESGRSLFGFKSKVAYRAALLAIPTMRTASVSRTGWTYDESVLNQPPVGSFAPDVPNES